MDLVINIDEHWWDYVDNGLMWFMYFMCVWVILVMITLFRIRDKIFGYWIKKDRLKEDFVV